MLYGLTIDRIAGNPMSHVCGMDANLMRAPGFQLKFNQGVISQSLLDDPVGNSMTTITLITRYYRHFFAIDRMATNRRVDRTRNSFRYSIHNAQIFSPRCFCLDLLLKMLVRKVIFGND